MFRILRSSRPPEIAALVPVTVGGADSRGMNKN
jgi:hypothetical protein